MVLFFDGACEPFNPRGIATWGIAVYIGDVLIHRDCGLACEPLSPFSTNNYAEYTGLVAGLEYCLGQGVDKLTVKGDSALVIKQMRGEYRVKSKNILPLYLRAKELSRGFSGIEYVWVRREQNTIADRLARQIYREVLETGDFGNKVFPFGIYNGKSLRFVLRKDYTYVKWLFKKLHDEGRDLLSVLLPGDTKTEGQKPRDPEVKTKVPGPGFPNQNSSRS